MVLFFGVVLAWFVYAIFEKRIEWIRDSHALQWKQINPFPNDSQNPSCLEYKGEICFSICNYFFSVHFLFCLLSQFASSLSGYLFNVIKVSFIYKINQFMHKRSTSQTLQIIMCKNIFLMLICMFCYMHLELSFLIWPIVPQSFDIWVPVYYFFTQ